MNDAIRGRKQGTKSTVDKKTRDELVEAVVLKFPRQYKKSTDLDGVTVKELREMLYTDDVSEVNTLKERLEQEGLGHLATIPYGQANQPKGADLQKCVAYWKALESNDEWPTTLLSFEAWCAATCYDDKDKTGTGGPAFQKLMQLLLGSAIKQKGGVRYSADDFQFNYMWNAKELKYGEMFVNSYRKFNEPFPEKVYSAKNAGSQLLRDTVDEKLINAGAHLSAHSRPLTKNFGLDLLNYSNNNQNPVLNDKIVPNSNSYGILGKHDWMSKLGITAGNAGEGGAMSSQNAGQGEVSKGVDTNESSDGYSGRVCWESTHPGAHQPCMLAKNSIAAIYGLYYYPGCEQEQLQWEVYEKVGGKFYKVRFRCPNPTYGQRNKDNSMWFKSRNPVALSTAKQLFVYEPLNRLNKKYLDTYFRHLASMNQELKKAFVRARYDHSTVGGVYRHTSKEAAEIKKMKKDLLLQKVLDKKLLTKKDVAQKKPKVDELKTLLLAAVGDDEEIDDLNKFEVPQVTRYRKLPPGHVLPSPFVHIDTLNYGTMKQGQPPQDPKRTMQIAPFLYDPNGKYYEKNAKVRAGDSLFRRAELFKDTLNFCNVSHTREENLTTELSFGFRVAQAHLLYPLYRKEGAEIMRDDRPQEFKEVGYMTEPKLTDHGRRRLKSEATTQELTGITRYLLNWSDYAVLGVDELRAKLLENTDPTSTAAPAPTPRVSTQIGAEDSMISSVDILQMPTDPIGEGQVADEPESARDLESMGENTDQAITESYGTDPDAIDIETENVIAKENTAVVETTFGPGGMDIADTVREITGNDNLLNKDEIDKAIRNEGLNKQPLPERSIKKDDREKQCHWQTADHQPWAHRQCYEQAAITYDPVLMNEQQVAQYRATYGDDTNLYLGFNSAPKAIKSIEIHWGARRAVMMDKISLKSDPHRINYAKILAIYFAEEGIGLWDYAEKQKGMLEGISVAGQTFTVTGEGQDNSLYQPPRPYKSSKKRNPKGTGEWQQLWGPVFNQKPEKVLSENIVKCIMSYDMCAKSTTDYDELEKKLNETCPAWRAALDKVTSNMTVAEWVTTPWHYELLPYTKQYAIFTDGECYSEGCKRCSRLFYEYPYHMYADNISGSKGTFGYVQSLFYPSDNAQVAARPLHDACFFTETGDWADATQVTKHKVANAQQENASRKQAARARKRKPLPKASAADQQRVNDADLMGDTPRENEFMGGSMMWPTYQLRKDLLHGNDKRRKEVIFNEAGMFFRRYVNAAYSDQMVAGNEAYYTSVPQGVMNSKRSKVPFGAIDYRLQRSHKFGNVCRDCVAVLDRAPGLMVRNNRWQWSGGMVSTNANQIPQQDSYQDWTSLMTPAEKDAVLAYQREKEKGEKADAEKLKELAKEWQKAGESLAGRMKSKQSKLLGDWTRIIPAPTISVQERMLPTPETTTEDKGLAVKMINEALKPGGQLDANFLQNAAVRDMLREIERKYVREDSYQKFDYVKQFDSDVKRMEFRNERVQWAKEGLIWKRDSPQSDVKLQFAAPTQLGKITLQRYKGGGDGTIYENCLVTQQYDPTYYKSVYDTKKSQNTNFFRYEVYLVSLRDKDANPSYPLNSSNEPIATQWNGDGFVMFWNSSSKRWEQEDPFAGRQVVQVRSMRQSRMFITYSLHRPITTDQYGRQVLEKMADALYELFGNDKWLSQMLKFGMKIVEMSTADNISSAGWGLINKTRKQDAMSKFYGGDVQTSYTSDTYETHINRVEVDGGCEIGPKMGHPHFHLLLTVEHFSYVQFDYYKMKAFLEIMFKGLATFHNFGGRTLRDPDTYLLGSRTEPFYGDNENPYVDIKLYPQDNWKEVLAAYVRKTSGSTNMFQVLAGRGLEGTAELRRAQQFARQSGASEEEIARATDTSSKEAIEQSIQKLKALRPS